MAERTQSPPSGHERTARLEGVQDQRRQRDLVFIPFEGMAALSSRKDPGWESLAGAVPSFREPDGEESLLDRLAGTSAVHPPVEKHAALLADSRLLHLANAGRGACLVNRMHETYGNGHVQKVIHRVRAGRFPESESMGHAVIQRRGWLETIGGWFGIGPEPQTIATTEPEEERKLPGPRIESEPREAPAAEREPAGTESAAAQRGGASVRRGSATAETPSGPVPLGQRIRELRDRTIPRLRTRIRNLTYEINAARLSGQPECGGSGPQPIRGEHPAEEWQAAEHFRMAA